MHGTTMMIIDAPLGEHGALYPLFDSIEALAQNAQLPELKLHANLLESALISHADLEDALLRPEIRQYVPLTSGLTDHEQIRAGLERVAAAVDEGDARRCFFETLAKTRRHFKKEESIIFAIARRELRRERQQELAGEWAQLRGVSID
jgi:hypothetical protein